MMPTPPPVPNYTDSMTLYTDHAVNTSCGAWVFEKDPDDSNFDYFYIRERNIYLYYYPDLYGLARLYLTVSVPKICRGNNIFPAYMSDMHKVYAVILESLARNVPALGFTTPGHILTMPVSRLDLFLMHRVALGTKPNHLEVYSKLQLGNYSNFQYNTTSYLFSSRSFNRGGKTASGNKAKAPSVAIRIYDKAKEVYVKNHRIPKAIEDDYDYFLYSPDQPQDHVRFEFQMRRSCLKRALKNRPVALIDVLNSQVQADIINRFIERLKLNRPILSVQNYRARVVQIFKRKPTQKKAFHLANYVRQGRKPPKPKQYAYISTMLKKHDIHIVTSKFGDLPPVPFLT
jgi:hypothetical protein